MRLLYRLLTIQKTFQSSHVLVTRPRGEAVNCSLGPKAECWKTTGVFENFGYDDEIRTILIIWKLGGLCHIFLVVPHLQEWPTLYTSHCYLNSSPLFHMYHIDTEASLVRRASYWELIWSITLNHSAPRNYILLQNFIKDIASSIHLCNLGVYTYPLKLERRSFPYQHLLYIYESTLRYSNPRAGYIRTKLEQL